MSAPAASESPSFIAKAFLDQVVWARDKLFRSWNTEQVLVFVTENFRDSDVLAKTLAELFGLFGQHRIAAENALHQLVCDDVGRHRLRRRSKVVNVVSGHLNRNVDWALTAARMSLLQPLEYVYRCLPLTLDRELLVGLYSIAGAWLSTIEAVRSRLHDGQQSHRCLTERKKRLEAVQKQLRHHGAPRPLTPQLLARLAKTSDAGRLTAEAIWRSRSADAGRLDAQSITQAVTMLVYKIAARNENYLLEALVPLLIARAVITPRDDEPGLPVWQLRQTARGGDKPELVFEVTSSACTVEVGIGKFSADGQRRNLCPETDRMSPILDALALGKEASRGRQPDVVMRFRHPTTNDSLFALGDAKNYSTSSSKRGCVEDMLGYFMSYGHDCRINLEKLLTGQDGWRTPALNPAGTLFLNKGAKKIPYLSAAEEFCQQDLPETSGANEADVARESKAVAVMTDLANTISPVLCLDLKAGHLGRMDADGHWHAPILKAWANRLVRQATRELLDKLQ